MKVKIVYTSTTGNTSKAVEVLMSELNKINIETEMFESDFGLEVNEFFSGADIYVLASYTDGDCELPDGIIDFYDDMEDFDLTGLNVAVIGTGDTGYDDFCGAVDILENQARENNANIVAPSLKILLSPDEEAVKSIKIFAKKLAQSVEWEGLDTKI